MIKLKRAYEKPEKADGYRILVDRLWPRGKKKDELSLDEWDRELAPSDSLRKSFGHDPARWPDFQKRYRQELKSSKAAAAKLREIAEVARKHPITLVYGAHDPLHNQAVVLKQVIEHLR